ncbi:MAG: hypothetical protein IKF82_01395 [Bacilli bacterium]|nr:hypothetical protein [Bacilli bacterium]
MANARKGTKAYENKLKYIHQYVKSMPRFFITLNPRTEADLIEWLEGKRKATYVKQLIRADMAKKKSQE